MKTKMSSNQAWAWYERQGWLCGFNYLPRTAVNWDEMWAEDTFDPDTIAQELRWAASIGYNSLRTNLSYSVWEQGPVALKGRITAFLELCEEAGISVMMTLLDDCEFSGQASHAGPQEPPIPGLHNSRAVGSPGRSLVMTPEVWPHLLVYVKDIIRHFRHDSRIILWDIYNEPTNRMIFDANRTETFTPDLEPFSQALMRKAVSWAREADPDQPLTIAAWHTPNLFEPDMGMFEHPADQLALELSDIISFHAYLPLEQLHQAINRLEPYDRPLLCTEWLGRHIGSLMHEQLPLFKRKGIGCFHWGLVKGKTQTHLPWPFISQHGGQSDNRWFHDVLDETGQPYDPEEMDLVHQLSQSSSEPNNSHLLPNNLPKTKRKATMKDVAQYAGVSQSTVSFVLNNAADVSIAQETRQRVHDAALALNYHRRFRGSDLKNMPPTVRTLGLIVDEIATSPFAAITIEGAQEAAWRHGYLLEAVMTGGDRDYEQAILENWLAQGINGVIYCSILTRSVTPPKILKQLSGVLVNCHSDKTPYPTVTPSEVLGGYVATEALIEKGYQRIAFIDGEMWMEAAKDRLTGYQKALRSHNMPILKELIKEGDFLPSGGYQQTRALLDQNPLPDAIFCGNDLMAVGCYEALKERGLQIPNDIAVMGYDDQEIAQHLNPGLTTVSLPHREMGRWAVEFLLSSKNSDPNWSFKLECPLVMRESI